MGRSNRPPKEVTYEESPAFDAKRTGKPMGKTKRERVAAKPRKELKTAIKKAFSQIRGKEEVTVESVERMQEIFSNHKDFKKSFASFAVVPNCEEELGKIVKDVVGGRPLAKSKKKRKAVLTAFRAAVGEENWNKIDGATLVKHASIEFIPPDKKLWEAHF